MPQRDRKESNFLVKNLLVGLRTIFVLTFSTCFNYILNLSSVFSPIPGTEVEWKEVTRMSYRSLFQLAALSIVFLPCTASSYAQHNPRVGPSGSWRDAPTTGEFGAVSANGTDVSLGGTRESCIAINPLDPSNVVYSSLFQSRTSTTGGVNWTPGVSNVVPAGYSQDGDPTLAFDDQGRWFYAYQGRHTASGGADEFISLMNPISGARISGPVKISTSGSTGAYNDKPWLAIDRYPSSPFVGRMYLVPFPKRSIDIC